MQIVIDIPEEYYKEALRGNFNVTYFGEAVRNHSTPLPKGHGRLIDGDRFDVISYQHTSDDFDNGVMWFAEQIDNAPTIIEADKGADNG